MNQEPLSFEEQYNPFISVDNVFSNADHWTAGGVGLVTENTLNGNYSVKVDAIKECKKLNKNFCLPKRRWF